MVIELLRKKGDLKPFGMNWQSGFFERWPEFYAKFLKPQEAKRFVTEDWDIFVHWFELYEESYMKSLKLCTRLQMLIHGTLKRKRLCKGSQTKTMANVCHATKNCLNDSHATTRKLNVSHAII
jgi:hypothetical protein